MAIEIWEGARGAIIDLRKNGWAWVAVLSEDSQIFGFAPYAILKVGVVGRHGELVYQSDIQATFTNAIPLPNGNNLSGFLSTHGRLIRLREWDGAFMVPSALLE